MNRRTRFGTTLSTIAIAAALSGCATGNAKPESIFGSKVDRSNMALATRAQAALASQDYATAIDLAERAVENTPNDAGYRSLLGNCYFAAGRFASAEAAYSDSLTLLPSQADLILKLALVQIAQGESAKALAALDVARNVLDPADYGLAVALAGRPDEAVDVLNKAARLAGADARVRQNLALAYGLSGDWTMARTVAAQDVPPDQLDSRVQQWMGMATPEHSYDQVAMLTGVKPAADPGQPERLALKDTAAKERFAQLFGQAPHQDPMPQQVAELPATPPPALPDPAPEASGAAAVVAEAAQTLLQPAEDPAPVEAEVVQAVVDKPVAELPTRFDAPVEAAKYVSISDAVRRAAEQERHSGRSNAVVQLGAYSSPERVEVAWKLLTKRYPALRGYEPMKARFNSARGPVWRLSIKGFDNRNEAVDRCEELQGNGGNCFVRTAAGDAPVQLASR